MQERERDAYYYPPIRHRGWAFWHPRRTMRGVPVPPLTVTDLDEMIEALRNPVTAIEVTRYVPPSSSGSIAPT